MIGGAAKLSRLPWVHGTRCVQAEELELRTPLLLTGKLLGSKCDRITRFAVDAGCVDKLAHEVVHVHWRLQIIPGGAGLGRYQCRIMPQERIEQAALADI